MVNTQLIVIELTEQPSGDFGLGGEILFIDSGAALSGFIEAEHAYDGLYRAFMPNGTEVPFVFGQDSRERSLGPFKWNSHWKTVRADFGRALGDASLEISEAIRGRLAAYYGESESELKQCSLAQLIERGEPHFSVIRHNND